jgi:hypothetical protein
MRAIGTTLGSRKEQSVAALTHHGSKSGGKPLQEYVALRIGKGLSDESRQEMFDAAPAGGRLESTWD